MIHVVFVCTGNICRSPMAEGILLHEWEKYGKSGLKVTSMGCYGLDNKEASEYSRKICMENDIDISRHRSRKLIYSELESADLILSMERVQMNFINLYFSSLKEKNFLLRTWPEQKRFKNNIHDPYGGSYRQYKNIFKKISKHINRVIPVLEALYF